MIVEVVPYNPDWKNQYKSEAELITKACGDKILTIEHAGSTSIEGLASKPIVDIYVGTKSLADANNIVNDMTGLGYEYVKDFEKELPFRRYFRKNVDGIRRYHVHVTLAPHPFRCSDLMFRDYISVNEAAKKEYQNLKLELSKTDWEKNDHYTNAKSDFILRTKKEAFKFFSELYEKSESEATYLMHSYSTDDEMKAAKFKMFREGGLTAIRTDIFPGFSLNRALGITNVNDALLHKIEEFFKDREGKFALQIPPYELEENKTALLHSRGYNYANAWVTFYKDSSPVETKGTDLEIKEIGREYSKIFAKILNEIFSFPREFDGISASSLGQKEWITFMAFDGDKTAGSAAVCITGDSAYLSYANVLPEYRRRGVQGELMKRRIDAARERGAKWIVVDTAETSDEHPNPSYWNMLRHGFRLLYHRPNYVKIQ